MTRVRTETPEDLRRLAEASAWRVTLSEHDLESSEAFEAWLAADARNGEAWARAQSGWSRFGEAATAPEIMTARRDALDRARRAQARRAGGVHFSTRSAIAATAALAVLGAGVAWWSQQPAVYNTALGERRTVTLADGSRVVMDSGTQVKVRLLRDARKLTLVHGQARFDVAHDVMRPFSVAARNQVVVATGTSFNVDVLGPKVMVTLIEGRVSVLQTTSGGPLHPEAVVKRAVPPTRLVAGQELVTTDAPGPVTDTPPSKVAQVNLDGATAWENGQLVFDNEPLSSVVERVGRYSDHGVKVADARTGDLRISGVFNAGDLDTFVDTLQRYLPVSSDRQADGSLILRQR